VREELSLTKCPVVVGAPERSFLGDP